MELNLLQWVFLPFDIIYHDFLWTLSFFFTFLSQQLYCLSQKQKLLCFGLESSAQPETMQKTLRCIVAPPKYSCTFSRNSFLLLSYFSPKAQYSDWLMQRHCSDEILSEQMDIWSRSLHLLFTAQTFAPDEASAQLLSLTTWLLDQGCDGCQENEQLYFPSVFPSAHSGEAESKREQVPPGTLTQLSFRCVTSKGHQVCSKFFSTSCSEAWRVSPVMAASGRFSQETGR